MLCLFYFLFYILFLYNSNYSVRLRNRTSDGTSHGPLRLLRASRGSTYNYMSQYPRHLPSQVGRRHSHRQQFDVTLSHVAYLMKQRYLQHHTISRDSNNGSLYSNPGCRFCFLVFFQRTSLPIDYMYTPTPPQELDTACTEPADDGDQIKRSLRGLNTRSRARPVGGSRIRLPGKKGASHSTRPGGSRTMGILCTCTLSRIPFAGTTSMDPYDCYWEFLEWLLGGLWWPPLLQLAAVQVKGRP